MVIRIHINPTSDKYLNQRYNIKAFKSDRGSTKRIANEDGRGPAPIWGVGEELTNSAKRWLHSRGINTEGAVIQVKFIDW